MSWSMYPVLAERSLVSCNLIVCSWMMLCSATADLSGSASLICLLCSLIRSWMYDRFVQYKLRRVHMGSCICPVSLIPMHPWLVEGSYPWSHRGESLSQTLRRPKPLPTVLKLSFSRWQILRSRQLLRLLTWRWGLTSCPLPVNPS